MYETFEHTADLGLRVRAADLPGLFVEAATGLFSMIVADLATVERKQQVAFRLEGTEPDFLLFDWLSELLFAFECQHLVFREFDVQLDSAGLSATAWGEPHDLARHLPQNEVKAITYHNLRVEQQPDGWLAELVVDI